ncbi:MAG: glycosyltransferase, partial [Deltaproteobacteria bacterium]|nr:glycosyltransferase [Deltaproteobacteria bacterium]
MAEPVKIFYLITSTNYGGTERALHELICRIDKEAFDVSVCSVKNPGGFAKRLQAEAHGFYTLGLAEAGGWQALLTFVPALLRLLRLLKGQRPQIVHSFLFRANILGRLAGRLAGIPIVISSVRVIESHKKYKYFIDRMTSSLVDRYTAVSEAARRFVLAQADVSAEKVLTIYNGVDVHHECRPAPLDFAVAENVFKVAFISRFDKQKGHAVLLRALKNVVVRNNNIIVYLWGEGPEEAQIKNMVAAADLSVYVCFMGTVDAVRSYLTRMDALVLPSLWEGMPNVVLEAMAEAKPVIASRIPGLDEVVVDGRTGLLVEPGDADGFAEAMITLME